MQRMMVAPLQFGANQGYGWETVDTEIEAHHDYCSLYQDDFHVRVWEPGRNRYSDPVYVGSASQGPAPALALGATIHGIKGNAYFRFDGSSDGVGVWRDADGVMVESQPTAGETYAALAGVPLLFEASPFTNLDRNPAFNIPVFCALYRGTYKSIDDQPGWEIDSGPTSDPDCILGLDITDPQVLESGRLDWWDMDSVRLPHYRIEAAGDLATGWAPTGLPTNGSTHRYALNLSANKRLGPDQVLWLHWKTGTIRLPVVRTELTTGLKILQCLYYQSHKFSVSVQASMLVTRHK